MYYVLSNNMEENPAYVCPLDIEGDPLWRELQAQPPAPSQIPIGLQIYDYEEQEGYPGISERYQDGFFVSERVANVFRRFCPEDEVLYIPAAIVQVGDPETPITPPIPYTYIRPKLQIECVDESKSIFMALESNKTPGLWWYRDIERLVLFEEKIKPHHYFFIKDILHTNFISEELAQALNELNDKSIYLRTINTYYTVHPLDLKRYLETGDAYKPRTISQGNFFHDKASYEAFFNKGGVRRRNLDDFPEFQPTRPTKPK